MSDSVREAPSVHKLGLGLDEIPFGFGQNRQRRVRMRPACLGDSLHHEQRKLPGPKVFPQPLLAFQVPIQPPHVYLHATPPFYVSTLGPPPAGFKGKRHPGPAPLTSPAPAPRKRRQSA